MINERKKNLLVELVKKRAPESLPVAEAFLSGSSLTNSQAEDLINLINAEFVAEGLKADYEPNALGLELEALLDDVNRERLKR